MKFPDQYMEISFEDSVFKGKLQEPIVFKSDLEFIFNQKAQHSKNSTYYYEFSKIKHQDRTPWRIYFEIDSKKRITSFTLPKRLGLVFGKEVIKNAIQAVGYGQISIGKRTFYLEMHDKIKIEQIQNLMGKPIKLSDNTWEFKFKNGKSELLNQFTLEKNLLKKFKISSNGYHIEAQFTQKDDKSTI